VGPDAQSDAVASEQQAVRCLGWKRILGWRCAERRLLLFYEQ